MPNTDLPDRIRAIADEVAAVLAAAPDGPTDPTTPGPGTPPAGVPAKPTGLTVVIGADARPVLAWDNPGDVDEWDIRDELNTARPVQATVREPRSTRSPLKTGQRRRYTVVARNECGDSEPSDPVDVPASSGPSPAPPDAAHEQLPTDVLPILKTWTITTTTGKPGSPDNLYPAKLNDGKGYIPGVFQVTDDGGVLFHAGVDGVTTKNSKRCRVEGRQMADAAWTKAAWNGADPHALDADLWVSTAGLQKRKRVSALQIHDGGDDVLQVVADAELGLAVLTDDGKTVNVLDPGYRDEQRFTCRIETGANPRRTGGKTVADVIVTYRSEAVSKTLTVTKTGTSWYFKAGAYLQASVAEHGEPPAAYGEVCIYRLDVTGDPVS